MRCQLLAGVGIYLPGLIVGILLSCGLIAINWKGAKVAGSVQNGLGCILATTGIVVIIFALIKLNPDDLMPIYENVG